MRVPMMAGNWKMNKNIAEAKALAAAIRDAVNDVDAVDKVVCPPFVDLPAVAEMLAGSNIKVGAQNMHWAANGAYTGEISPGMLAGLAQYVILGHSERRQYFAETDETVNKKVKAALEAGLIPIVCCGESLEQNEAGETQSFVSGLDFLIDRLVRLGKVLAALAVTQDHILRQPSQHAGADLAGVCAVGGPVHVLRPNLDVAARQHFGHGGQIHKRRTDHAVHRVHVVDRFANRRGQRLGFGDVLVHFPVARHHRHAHNRFSFCFEIG